MREIGSIIGGMGFLIFAYLLLANSQGSSTIASSISSSGSTLITALQGRSNNGLS